MTIPPERYSDLLQEHDDPALARLVDALDRALHALPVPSPLHTRLQQVLAQRTGTPSTAAGVGLPSPAAVTRKEVLKTGVVAAGMAWLLALGHTSPAIAGEVNRLAQAGPMSAARLVAILRRERAQWDALLAMVGQERMDLPGVEGEWSVKQIVAHLTWYEGVVVEGARQLLSTGTFIRTGLRALSLDERNAILAAQSQSRPVRDVLAESEQVFGQLLAVVAGCPDEILNDPRRLGLPEDVVPWTLVANNSYAHYQEHAPAIRAWLDTLPASPGA
ncbi:MAG TPA: DinB family protein [Chloroflexota bacterium]|nr:DinB family protein [Chloroflexota bacterium]